MKARIDFSNINPGIMQAMLGLERQVRQAGFDSKLLDPRAAWADPADYDRTAQTLVRQFVDNFAQFEGHVDEGVRNAAPVAVARSAGLHTSRIDGSALAYNQPDPKLPDVLVCRPELAEAVLAVTAE